MGLAPDPVHRHSGFGRMGLVDVREPQDADLVVRDEGIVIAI